MANEEWQFMCGVGIATTWPHDLLRFEQSLPSHDRLQTEEVLEVSCGKTPNYCWVVLCENHWWHVRQNLFFRHRIPLAPTDSVAPLPSLDKPFPVLCDECGKTYTYKAKDLLRV